jgi:hypothetical protein
MLAAVEGEAVTAVDGEEDRVAADETAGEESVVAWR